MLTRGWRDADAASVFSGLGFLCWRGVGVALVRRTADGQRPMERQTTDEGLRGVGKLDMPAACA